MTFIKRMKGIGAFGIDKTRLRNIPIVKINKKKIQSAIAKGVVTVVKTDDWRSKKSKDERRFFYDDTKEKIYIDSISIRDDDNKYFNYYKYTCRDGVKPKTGYIELTIGAFREDGINLIPLKVNEFHEMVKLVQLNLWEKYGIYIDISNAKFEELELNVTILTDREFKSYGNILKVCYLNHTSYFEPDAPFFYKDGETSSLRLHNKYLQLLIYNKKYQLEKQGIVLDAGVNIMRIEYKFKENKPIIKNFGNITIWEFTDDMIKEFLEKRIKLDITNRVNEFIKKTDIYIRKKFRADKKIGKIKPQSILEHVNENIYLGDKDGIFLNYIFDIEQLYKTVYEFNKDKYKANRSIERIEKRKMNKDCYENKKNNLVCHNEITSKINKILK